LHNSFITLESECKS